MAATLAPLAEQSRGGWIEEDHSFGGQRAAFGRTERQHVDTAAPSQLGRRSIAPNERIGEAGAIHMDRKRSLPRYFRQTCDFGSPINGTRFGRLRNRQRRRNHLMRAVAAIAGKRRRQDLGRDLAGLPGEAGKLEAMAEEFWCAAFVGSDVRLRMTQHNAPGRGDLRQRQRICRGACRHKKSSDFAFEDLAKAALDGPRPVVIPVASGVAAIGLSQGIENGRRHWRGIVTGKIHAGTDRWSFLPIGGWLRNHNLVLWSAARATRGLRGRSKLTGAARMIPLRKSRNRRYREAVGEKGALSAGFSGGATCIGAWNLPCFV